MKGKSSIPYKGNVSRVIKKQKIKEYLLLVTEGEKTEPLYFKALRKCERIITAKLEVYCSEFGSNPLNIVDYAIELKRINLKENKRDGEPKYDTIYCIFDRDDHAHFHDAIIKARDNNIAVIKSIPCFEIWYLLHFDYSTKSYYNREELYSKLRKLLGAYEKSDILYDKLRDNLCNAIIHANKLRLNQSKICDLKNDHPNPYTDVDILVSHLLSLAEK